MVDEIQIVKNEIFICEISIIVILSLLLSFLFLFVEHQDRLGTIKN